MGPPTHVDHVRSCTCSLVTPTNSHFSGLLFSSYHFLTNNYAYHTVPSTGPNHSNTLVGFWLFVVGGLQGKFGQWADIEGERKHLIV
jgi:hypothetical protein